MLRAPFALAIAASLLAASAAQAAVFLTPASLLIDRGTSVAVPINITRTAGETTFGVEFTADVSLNGAPIVDVDFASGIYGPGGTKLLLPAFSDPFSPTYTYDIESSVPAQGLLANIVFNTSSLPLGRTFTVDLNLDVSPTLFFTGNTSFSATDTGPFTLTVVPEPTSLAALAGAGLLLLRRKRA